MGEEIIMQDDLLSPNFVPIPTPNTLPSHMTDQPTTLAEPGLTIMEATSSSTDHLLTILTDALREVVPGEGDDNGNASASAPGEGSVSRQSQEDQRPGLGLTTPPSPNFVQVWVAHARGEGCRAPQRDYNNPHNEEDDEDGMPGRTGQPPEAPSPGTPTTAPPELQGSGPGEGAMETREDHREDQDGPYQDGLDGDHGPLGGQVRLLSIFFRHVLPLCWHPMDLSKTGVHGGLNSTGPPVDMEIDRRPLPTRSRGLAPPQNHQNPTILDSIRTPPSVPTILVAIRSSSPTVQQQMLGQMDQPGEGGRPPTTPPPCPGSGVEAPPGEEASQDVLQPVYLGGGWGEDDDSMSDEGPGDDMVRRVFMIRIVSPPRQTRHPPPSGPTSRRRNPRVMDMEAIGREMERSLAAARAGGYMSRPEVVHAPEYPLRYPHIPPGGGTWVFQYRELNNGTRYRVPVFVPPEN